MTVATLVASPSLARALLVRWYITVPGIILSLVLAGGTTALFPPQYASTGTVALIPAPLKGGNSLLTFDSGLSTSAEIVVQAMNDPQVAKDMGLVKGQDTVAVVNGSANSSGKIVETSGPFLSVTAQSSTAERSTALAQQATARIREELTQLQQSVKVKKQQSINVSEVVSPAPGKLVVAMLLRTFGLAALVGLVLTLGAVCLVDRRARQRRSRAEERDAALPALRSTNGALQRLDKLDGADLLLNGQSPDPIGKSGRKASVTR